MQTSHQDETTNDEILHAIKDFAEHVEGRFNHLEERQDRMEQRQDRMEQRQDRTEERQDRTEERQDRTEERQDRMELGQEQIKRHLFQSDERLDRIETSMVTKDYLDEKLLDLKSDLVIILRKEDIKVTTLVNILVQNKLIDQKQAEQVLGSGPFPQIA